MSRKAPQQAACILQIPYDVPRISADVLDTGEYAKGIRLLTQKSDAVIHYYYTYTMTDGNSITTQNLVYDNTPITVNSSMTGITITAWLTDRDGNETAGSKETFPIEFVHLKVPVTSLGSDNVEFPKGREYTLINDYPDDGNIFIYYTTDGTDPTGENGKVYGGETLTLNEGSNGENRVFKRVRKVCVVQGRQTRAVYR